MANTVTKRQINEILTNSEYEVFHKIFGKQCIVVAKLPNGFTVVGESACVDPNNYIESIGEEIAKKRIEEKVWELEGYKLQDEIASLEFALRHFEHLNGLEVGSFKTPEDLLAFTKNQSSN